MGWSRFKAAFHVKEPHVGCETLITRIQLLPSPRLLSLIRNSKKLILKWFRSQRFRLSTESEVFQKTCPSSAHAWFRKIQLNYQSLKGAIVVTLPEWGRCKMSNRHWHSMTHPCPNIRIGLHSRFYFTTIHYHVIWITSRKHEWPVINSANISEGDLRS